jgi:hypothetical protein
MKYKVINPVRVFFLVPLAVLSFVSAAAQAQTPPTPGASASMPQGHMQQGNSGAEEMKHAMMMGMDSMQKMPISSCALNLNGPPD